MTKKVCLCIHGHFYQPPRENPWIEAIELQESASPFHDWNERIHYESYLPNTLARVLDEKGHILDIVNNFETMSFNFGPTLLSWLEEKHPETYQAILEADHASVSNHHGHGNAMAQAYNHMILPLANQRDKVTQIRWGIEDFRRRFGREPESIWLPETACNEETLEVLLEEGIRFIILSPYQAEAVRPLSGGEWADVSFGQIDPKLPYRCFLKNNPEKFIDIFFYDGPISRAVGFGDLAFDARRYMDAIEKALGELVHADPLVHVAVDGETYGHHKPFADRALAYLMQVEAPKRGFHVVNYGEFLELCPPQHEVRLKEGEGGEGTSWSCAHGVKRWKEHCGCRGGGPAEWTQHWRKPLREALDWLRDELFIQFVTLGGDFFKHVWEARNDYIDVILDRSEKNIAAFFDRHAKRPLSREEIILCLKLLEIQRHAMLMYTSCGWFFTEISGIETVQILQYAARAIQLAQEAGTAAGSSLHHHLEKEFLRRLAHAKSNVLHYKDGRGVYEKLAKPSFASFPEILSHYAMNSIFEDYPEDFRIYAYRLRVLHQRKESYGDVTLNFGRVRIRSLVTLEESDLVFIAVQFGTYDFRCSVRPFTDAREFEQMESEFFDELSSVHVVELIRKIDAVFGQKYTSLKDLFFEERLKIVSILTKEALKKISGVYESLYEENRKMNEVYRSMNLPIPAEIRFAAEHTLTRRLEKAVQEMAEDHYDFKKITGVTRVIEIAKSFHVELDKLEVLKFLSRELTEKTKRLLEELREEWVAECLSILKTAKKIGVELQLRKAQDYLFFLLRKWQNDPYLLSSISPSAVDRIFELAVGLEINTSPFRKEILR
jgi:alpha-amylase/alpha-mannosidase (GH57 family)